MARNVPYGNGSANVGKHGQWSERLFEWLICSAGHAMLQVIVWAMWLRGGLYVQCL